MPRASLWLAGRASACSPSSLPGCAAAAGGAPAAPAVTTTAQFAGHGSLGEAYVTGAPPGARLVLADAAGRVAGSGTADAYGSLVLRDVTPGTGYSFRMVGAHGVAGTKSFRVLTLRDVPPTSFYASQHLHAGLNYLVDARRRRAGGHRPSPPGQVPRRRAVPHRHRGVRVRHRRTREPRSPPSSTRCSLENQTLLPDSATAVGSVVAPLLGFATVSLQMRGTGCSGGAFGLFDLPTTADGYDATEIVAAQPFVKGPSRRDGRHLLLGHLAAVRGRDAPPHLAAARPHERDRRPVLHRLPGWDLQRRVRRQLDPPARGRRPARTGRRAGLRQGADRPG